MVPFDEHLIKAGPLIFHLNKLILHMAEFKRLLLAFSPLSNLIVVSLDVIYVILIEDSHNKIHLFQFLCLILNLAIDLTFAPPKLQIDAISQRD